MTSAKSTRPIVRSILGRGEREQRHAVCRVERERPESGGEGEALQHPRGSALALKGGRCVFWFGLLTGLRPATDGDRKAGPHSFFLGIAGSPASRQQAKALQSRARETKAELVVVSPMSRALMTSNIAFAHCIGHVPFLAHESCDLTSPSFGPNSRREPASSQQL